jgi:hypothetical protein
MSFFTSMTEKFQTLIPSTLFSSKPKGRSPSEVLLTEHIDSGNFVEFKAFVERERIDLNIIFFNDRTLLQSCITNKLGQNILFIDYILANAKKMDFERVDKQGKCAIFEACYWGRVDVIDRLMGLGADYKRVNVNMLGMNGVHFAMMRRKYYAVFKLIENGVSVEWMKETAAEVHWRHPGMEVKLIDEKIIEIFEYFDITKPRIENYFRLINVQIDYVNYHKRSNSSTGVEGQKELGSRVEKNSLKYSSILGKIPKYALKDIVTDHLLVTRNGDTYASRVKFEDSPSKITLSH